MRLFGKWKHTKTRSARLSVCTTKTRRLSQAVLFTVATLLVVGCATPPPAEPQRSASEVEALKRVRFEDSPEGARAILDESILFKFGEAEFLGSADPVLDVLRPAFAKARGQIIVEGHTDTRGGDAYNLQLSQKRADKVRAALIARQVPPARVVSKAMGKTNPRRAEATDEDRRLNRRAEIVFAGETVQSLEGKAIEQRAEGVMDQLAKALGEAGKKVGGLLDNLKEAVKAGK